MAGGSAIGGSSQPIPQAVTPRNLNVLELQYYPLTSDGQNSALVSVTTFSSVRKGTLTIKVSSRHKRVLIDGIAIGRV